MSIVPRHVHVVDDDDGVRRSTDLLLRSNGFATSPWSSGIDFLHHAAGLTPGCVLLDIRMPQMDGLQVLQELMRRGATMPVVMLTGHGDISAAIRAMKAGAIDFLEKPVEKATLIAALEDAFEKLAGLHDQASARVRARNALTLLTQREHDIVVGLADGLSNKGIALRLDISPRTVEIHRANALKKLGAASLAQALRIAFNAGLVARDS